MVRIIVYNDGDGIVIKTTYPSLRGLGPSVVTDWWGTQRHYYL